MDEQFLYNRLDMSVIDDALFRFVVSNKTKQYVVEYRHTLFLFSVSWVSFYSCTISSVCSFVMLLVGLSYKSNSVGGYPSVVQINNAWLSNTNMRW